jgi:hypothetical protein
LSAHLSLSCSMVKIDSPDIMRVQFSRGGRSRLRSPAIQQFDNARLVEALPRNSEAA